MTSFTLRRLSVAVLAIRVALLTFSNIGPWARGLQGRAHFIIPIAYFTMILGAIGLSVGWYLQQR